MDIYRYTPREAPIGLVNLISHAHGPSIYQFLFYLISSIMCNLSRKLIYKPLDVASVGKGIPAEAPSRGSCNKRLY